MFQKVKNTLHIPVEGAELTKATHLEFYLRQGGLFFKYTPTVVNDNEIVVEIPKSDADRLKHTEKVRCQLVFTDNSGNDIPSEITETTVYELLAPEGYDGN